MKVTTARLCCDVDVGALALNLVGMIDNTTILFNGILLPSRINDLEKDLRKIIRNKTNISPEVFGSSSSVYVTGNNLVSIGKELVCENRGLTDGMINRVYLANSGRVLGNIFYKVKGMMPPVIGYAGSVKGRRGGKLFNDDSVLVLGAGYCHAGVEKNTYVVVVADGVSSLKTGYRASSLAVEGFVARVVSLAYTNYSINFSDVYKSYTETAEEINKVNQAYGVSSASTFTAMVFPVNGLAYIVHVGDTRAYLFNNNELVQLTEDHKIAGTNTITRALGSNNYEPQTQTIYFKPGTTVVLASDGLYEVVGVHLMKTLLTKFTNTTKVVEELLHVVVKKAGRDDASVGIIKRLI